MANCPACGSALKPGSRFCTVCGTRNLTGAGPLPVLPPSAGTPLLPAPLAAHPPSPAALLVSAQGQQQPVTDQMTIGRDPSATLFLDVDDISRRHATIVARPTGWAVLDLGSRNGTFVNDQQVLAATAIYHKDRLRFGAQTEFALYDPTHVRASPPAGSLPATRVVTLPASTQSSLGASGAGTTPQPTGLTRYQWPRNPQVEGYVLSIHGPTMADKDGKIGKALLSVGLGLINPALAFLPWTMGKNQIAITQMRVEDFDTGRHVAVTLLGDLRTSVQDGDFVAVWGKVEQGTLYAVDLFNYQTEAMIRLRG